LYGVLIDGMYVCIQILNSYPEDNGEYGELLMPANGIWDLNLARLWE